MTKENKTLEFLKTHKKEFVIGTVSAIIAGITSGIMILVKSKNK